MVVNERIIIIKIQQPVRHPSARPPVTFLVHNNIIIFNFHLCDGLVYGGTLADPAKPNVATKLTEWRTEIKFFSSILLSTFHIAKGGGA